MDTSVLAVPGRHGEHVNVSAGERMLSVFAGGALAAIAARQHGWWAGGLATGGALLLWRGFTGTCPFYAASGVNSAQPERMTQVTQHSLTVNKPADEVYAFWRDFSNLPRIMKNLEYVRTDNGGQRSTWCAKGPAGRKVEWDAEITADEPGRLIAWRSLPGGDVPNSGRVEFRPGYGGRGTVVDVEIRYQPPAGSLGLGLAKLTGHAPDQELREDLRRLKQILETGEIPTTEGQSALHRRSMFWWLDSSAK